MEGSQNILELQIREAEKEQMAFLGEIQHPTLLTLFVSGPEVSLKYIRKDICDELLEALKDIIKYVSGDTVECRGNKCRDLWCVSCYGEEEAGGAAEKSRNAIRKARDAIAKVEVLEDE